MVGEGEVLAAIDTTTTHFTLEVSSKMSIDIFLKMYFLNVCTFKTNTVKIPGTVEENYALFFF